MVSPPTSKAHVRARRLRLGGTIVSLAAFVLLTWYFLFTVPGQNLDNLTMESLTARVAAIPEGLSAFPSLVSVPAVAAVSIVVGIIAILRRRPALAFRALSLVGAANLTTQILKALLERPDLGVSLALDNSFPSGHTTFAASVAVALVLVAPKGFRSAASIFGWAWTSLIGTLVISLGWHRLSDVVGALLVVAVWAFLLCPIEERVRIFPFAVQLGNWLSWLVFITGTTLFAVVSKMLEPEIFEPLSFQQIASLVAGGQRLGQALAVITVLVVAGVAGVVISSVDRFSSVRPVT